jgi:hypothetical protein
VAAAAGLGQAMAAKFKWMEATVEVPGGGLPYGCCKGETVYVRKKDDTRKTGRTVIVVRIANGKMDVRYLKPEYCRKVLKLGSVTTNDNIAMLYASYCCVGMRQAREDAKNESGKDDN